MMKSAFCSLAMAAVLGGSAECRAAGRPYAAYRSFLPSVEMTGRFAGAGVEVRTFGVCNTRCGDGSRLYSDPITWTGPGRYDWEGVDKTVRDLVAVSPRAKFIACIDLNTPEWKAARKRGDSFNTIGRYATNTTWRTETAEWLVACLDHLERTCGDRMLAYALMAGMTTEWFQYMKPPAAMEMNKAAFENQIYDPEVEKGKIDYWRMHNRGIADALLFFAHKAKGRVPASREIGAFFGYYNVCYGDWFASGGHLDYPRVAASPDVDFFLSPATYAERGIGCGTGSQSVAGTLRRYGKRLFHEIDFRTSAFSDPTGGITKWPDVPSDLAGLTREAAFALVYGCSWWWFDLFTPSNFSNPAVLSRIERLQELHRQYADAWTETSADALLVCDPEAALNCVEGGKIRFCGDLFRNKLNRIGIMYDVYSFDDLAALDLAKYRLVCLPATWVITPQRAELLERKLCGGGRTVLWTYAPGVSDGATLDASRVSRWAGVAYGTPGLSCTDRGSWKSVYLADPAALTKEQLRKVAEAAGCHVWTDELLPVAANDRLLAVHSATGGEKTIRLKTSADEIVDLLTGEVVARRTETFRIRFASPETKVFALKRGLDR